VKNFTYFTLCKLQVSDKLLKDERHFGLDLPSMNMFRGREYGIGTYNDYRELCGLTRAKTWYDFNDWIDPEVKKTNYMDCLCNNFYLRQKNEKLFYLYIF